MEQTGRAAIAAMRERGYDMSVICNGASGYYGRFGYALGWPETDIVIQTADLPVAPPEVRLGECATEQRADFVALYNNENATVTGTAVRPTFPRGKHPGNGRGVYWTGAGGATGGYIFYDVHEPTNTLWHDDSAGDVEQRLRVLGTLARQLSCAQVRFERLPCRSAIGQRLRQLSCCVEEKFVRDGGWMLRIINLRSLLEQLAPELERRLAGSYLASWSGKLLLASADERALLQIEQGCIRVAPPAAAPHALLAGGTLAQFVIGTDAPEELAANVAVQLRGEAARLLAVLFPAQRPQMSNDDL
jgi:hypothetical protein